MRRLQTPGEPSPPATWCVSQMAARPASPWAHGLQRLPSPQHHRSRRPHTTGKHRSAPRLLYGTSALVPGEHYEVGQLVR
jgi:hypothetical protein